MGQYWLMILANQYMSQDPIYNLLLDYNYWCIDVLIAVMLLLVQQPPAHKS